MFAVESVTLNGAELPIATEKGVGKRGESEAFSASPGACREASWKTFQHQSFTLECSVLASRVLLLKPQIYRQSQAKILLRGKTNSDGCLLILSHRVHMWLHLNAVCSVMPRWAMGLLWLMYVPAGCWAKALIALFLLETLIQIFSGSSCSFSQNL